MANPNELLLNFIVNGKPHQLEVNIHQPIHVAVNQALKDSGNSGQSLGNWELRDGAGTTIDLSKKIEDYAFPAGSNLFLSLKAGVGGSW